MNKFQVFATIPAIAVPLAIGTQGIGLRIFPPPQDLVAPMEAPGPRVDLPIPKTRLPAFPTEKPVRNPLEAPAGVPVAPVFFPEGLPTGVPAAMNRIAPTQTLPRLEDAAQALEKKADPEAERKLYDTGAAFGTAEVVAFLDEHEWDDQDRFLDY